MSPRVSRPAWALWNYLRGVKKLHGWLKVKISTLARHYHRSESTIKRWLGELFAANRLRSKRRGRKCPEYEVLIPQSDTSEQGCLFNEPSEVAPSVNQHHRDDAARIAAGFERLSQGDLKFLRDMERQTIPITAIQAGIWLGRARKLCSDINRGVCEKILSLRYFAGSIREAAKGLPPGYAEHQRAWLIRKGETA
jgi:hypothetical protein